MTLPIVGVASFASILTCISLAASGIVSPAVPAAVADEGDSVRAPAQMATGLIVKRNGNPARTSVALSRSSVSRIANVPVHDVDVTSLPGSSVYRFDHPVDVASLSDAMTTLRNYGGVEWVEPDLVVRRSAELPNDPDFKNQWHLWDGGGARDYSVNAPAGWAYAPGKTEVLVAVLDTGWTDHPDLAQNVVNGYDFVSDDLVANDGDGRDSDAHDPGDWITASDASGYFSGCDVSDSSWHGTHVAGIVAAARDNRRGVSGVAPDVRVMAVRVLGKCFGTTSDIATAIRWASGASVPGVPDNPFPAQVISMSLGSTGSCSSAFREAIQVARSNGSAVVAAAGNEGSPINDASPASCPGVISVVATNPSGTRPNWSNYGTDGLPASIAAPGESILSTYNAGRQKPGAPTYERLSGTSMATPLAAGAVALLMSTGIEAIAIPQALGKLTKRYPTGGAGRPCSKVTCGPGLLDLSQLRLFAGPGPGPDPDPGPDPSPGPVPLEVPGIIDDLRVRYVFQGSSASAYVSWAHTDGAQRSLYFMVRVKRGSERWSTWTRRVTSSLTVERLPRAEMSFLEIQGVNEMGQGLIYQATLFPRR